MSYIKFDKNQLVNLEYSLTKELIRTSREGAYSSTTIIHCNTRRYHGLLVVPQPDIDGGNHVLLSAVDETVIQQNAEFNLALHKFKGEVFSPKGHKYLKDFVTDPIPKHTYSVGGVELTKEAIFSHTDGRLITRYTLVKANYPTRLRFRPLLAYRNIHNLSKKNDYVNTSYDVIDNGIRTRMYERYSDLYIQLSKAPEFNYNPDWYRDFEYDKDRDRGYEFLEDLYSPGTFEVDIELGESIYFSAGDKLIDSSTLDTRFKNEMSRRIPRDSYEHCLLNAAEQFIVKLENEVELIAGYPWFGRWGRDAFISLPGLTFVAGDTSISKKIFENLLDEMRGPLFPNKGVNNILSYSAADTPLWMFWTLQQYSLFTGKEKELWTLYGDALKKILYGYRDGTEYNIHMDERGLIFAGEEGECVTWMDAKIDGWPVTPRNGYAVEINALWYNAVMFAIELATLCADTAFIEDWTGIAKKIPAAFTETFWSDEKGYLADYVNGDFRDFSLRPNQLFATSLQYICIDEAKCNSILKHVKNELLTPRGIRSLAPKNPLYKGIYKGNQKERDLAYHNGTAYPWLLGAFAEGFLRVHGKAGVPLIVDLYKGFEAEMTEHGVGTISEVYDGDPPHQAGGGISQAWNVGELLRINWLIRRCLSE